MLTFPTSWYILISYHSRECAKIFLFSSIQPHKNGYINLRLEIIFSLLSSSWKIFFNNMSSINLFTNNVFVYDYIFPWLNIFVFYSISYDDGPPLLLFCLINISARCSILHLWETTEIMYVFPKCFLDYLILLFNTIRCNQNMIQIKEYFLFFILTAVNIN